MLRRNNGNSVSPIEQMYFLNRLNGTQMGLGGLGALDPYSAIASKISTLFGKLFSFGGDPYRDIHIPAQNAAEQGFADILTSLDRKKATGALTVADIQSAVASVQNIDANFRQLTNQLTSQHPESASRYQAGYSDIHNLEQQILSGLTAQHYGVTSSVMGTFTSAFTNPGGGVSMTGIAILAAGIFFLPKLLKRG